MLKTDGLGPLLEVEFRKVHAVVARSTFSSQNVQNTPWSDHFWKLSLGKKITERSKWMDAWLDRQKDGEFNSLVNKQIER